MSEPSDWIIVSNPSSGGMRLRRIKRSVMDFLQERGFSFHTVENALTDEFVSIFSQVLADNPPRRGVIIIGGDGTVHLSANVIHRVNARIPFGVIPAGTGNDFAYQCGMDKMSVKEILHRFTSSAPVKIDVVVADDRICLQVLSTGFDAEVSERARNLSGILGRFRYVVALFLELARLRLIRYEIDHDGVIHTTSAVMVSCANGRNYGGGMLLSPDSDHEDGFLELIILHPVSRFELLTVFPKIFSGRHVSHPAFEIRSFQSLQIRGDTIAQGDGEPMFRRPLNISINLSSLHTWKA